MGIRGPRQRGFAKVLLVMAGALGGLLTANSLLWLLNLGQPVIFQTSASCGYIARPNQWASPLGFDYHINQYGLRGPSFPSQRPKQSVRLAFIGDSITFGGGRVRPRALFVNVAARILRQRTGANVQPINISEPGWGIQNMDGYLAHQGLHDANAVVWVIPTCDFRRPRITIGRNFQVLTREPSLRIMCLLRVGWRRLTERADPSGSAQSYWVQPDALRANLHAFRDALLRIKGAHAVALTVFVPQQHRPAYAGHDLRAYQRVATSLDVPTCNLAADFARSKRDLFYDGFHLNTSGHRLVGHLIAACISRSWQIRPAQEGKRQNSVTPIVSYARVVRPHDSGKTAAPTETARDH